MDSQASCFSRVLGLQASTPSTWKCICCHTQTHINMKNHVCGVPREARTGHQMPRAGVTNSMWVQGIEPSSSGRVVSTLSLAMSHYFSLRKILFLDYFSFLITVRGHCMYGCMCHDMYIKVSLSTPMCSPRIKFESSVFHSKHFTI